MVGECGGPGVSQAAVCRRNCEEAEGIASRVRPEPREQLQIALRLPAPDLAKARKIAGHKGIGYQTLLKMQVHEGLQREARRQ